MGLGRQGRMSGKRKYETGQDSAVASSGAARPLGMPVLWQQRKEDLCCSS